MEIAGETAKCARIFGIDPQIAFLSYSTFGSGKGEDVDKMRNAAEKAKKKYPDLPIEGEMQFDAAVSPRVARTKCRIPRWQAMPTPSFSRISTPETSVTRLLREWVISTHTVRFCSLERTGKRSVQRMQRR